MTHSGHGINPGARAARVKRRLWHSLLSVVLGNAIYLLVEPSLPAAARHTTYRLDWGLVIDFWLCLVCYGLLAMLGPFRRR